jgi:2-polyprenyl-6-hydroxyphenyl methylase/3-demethylubiquinone-9 3-methyltransferase
MAIASTIEPTVTASVGSGWHARTSPAIVAIGPVRTRQVLTIGAYDARHWAPRTFRETLDRVRTLARPRNDPGQYDDLAAEWWRPGGVFAMLHWIAAARARLIPPAAAPGAVLVDIGCGAGLLAPHLAGKGYQHVGVDLTRSALLQAQPHGVRAVTADAARLPLADGVADVVSAGEILEHVPDRAAVVAEACRVLRPGGLLVLDTLNATAISRFIVVTLAERVPGAAPPGLHDPNLFVPRRVLMEECARHGVPITTRGLRPAIGGMVRWIATRRGEVAMVPTRSTAVIYQGIGVKKEET